MPSNNELLQAHVAKERHARSQDPPDDRPLHSLSASRYRFRSFRDEDRAALGKRIEEVCAGELWRSEMTRTYLEQGYSWRVHDGDLLMPDGIACFDTNLVVTGDVACEAYVDEGSVLIVMGSLRCAEMYSAAGLCVLGDTIVGGTMLHFDNDWAFECLGRVSARAFVSEDKMTTFSRERSVIEYYSHDHSLESNAPDAMAWLALDPDEDAIEHVQVLRNAYANGRDPLPPPAVPSGSGASDPTEHDDERARARRASRLRSSDGEAFEKLAADPAASVRAECAVNAACPETHWPSLARDADAGVRANLVYGRYATGQALPGDLQALLARDADAHVRRAVAVLPALDPALAQALRDDPDTVVRKRVNAVQPMDAAALMRQLEDRDPSVRANLAARAVSGKAPFDAHRDLRTQAIQTLLFDPDAGVRKAAASWQPPPFIEAHQDKLAADTVPEVRALVAGATRDAALQRRLAEDPEQKVRLALIGNAQAHPDVLAHFAKKLPTGSMFEIGEGLMELARHPRLTPEAAQTLHERVPDELGSVFAEQPNLPVRALVARVCHDVPYEPGDWEYDDYQRCKATFPELAVVDQVVAEGMESEGLGARLMDAGIAFPRRWYHKPLLFLGILLTAGGALFKTKHRLRKAVREGTIKPVSEAEIDALFHHMLDSKLHNLNHAALGNARCPPDRLAKYMTDYLGREGDETDYLIGYVAANPSLPQAVMPAVVERLIARHDYELRKGFLRNPAVSAEHLQRLAAEGDGDTRHEAKDALWNWHGEWR